MMEHVTKRTMTGPVVITIQNDAVTDCRQAESGLMIG